MRIIRRIGIGVMWLLLTTSAPIISASSSDAVRHVLEDTKIGNRYHVHHVVVDQRYGYVLATDRQHRTPWLALCYVWLNEQHRWRIVGAEGIQIGNRPWRLFGQREKLICSLGKGPVYGTGEDVMFDFSSWCLYGYTTDPTVTQILLKTKLGRYPIKVVDNRFFVCLLTERERESFVEVQGLNSQGTVVQRWNGQAEHKPRPWSPSPSAIPW